MVLVKKQRNELAEIIAELGLEPAILDVNNGPTLFYVRHKGTGFEFNVAHNSSKSLLEYDYSVNTIPKNIIMEDHHFGGHAWGQILNGFRVWATLLMEEIELPDLWAEMLSGNKFLAEGASFPDEKFSPLEIKELEGRVVLIEQQISTMALPVDAKAAFSEIARELPEDAKLLTKKKLGDLLTGQLVGQGLKWALTSEHMQAIWQTFKVFTQLFLN